MSKVLKGQSLFDIAIQETGIVESVFDIAIKNGLSITDDLSLEQSEIQIPSDTVTNKRTVSYYQTRGYHPASETDIIQNGGIDYMAIEIDFIVS